MPENRIISRYLESADRKSILQTVCAYANEPLENKPAVLAVRIRDEKGEPAEAGSRAAIKAMAEQMASISELFTNITPEYFPKVETSELDGCAVILITVAPGKDYPYVCPADPQRPWEDICAFAVEKEEKEEEPEEPEETEGPEISETSAKAFQDEVTRQIASEFGLDLSEIDELIEKEPEAEKAQPEEEVKPAEEEKEELPEEEEKWEAEPEKAEEKQFADDRFYDPQIDEPEEASVELFEEDNYHPFLAEETARRNQQLIEQFRKEQEEKSKASEPSPAALENLIDELTEPSREEPVQQVESVPVPAEPVSRITYSLKDHTASGYVRVKRFAGSEEEQLGGISAYLSNYIYESRIFPPDPREVSNFPPEGVRRMIQAAGAAAKESVEIQTEEKAITVSFKAKPGVTAPEDIWNVEVKDGMTRYVMTVDPEFVNGFDAGASRRRTPEEIKRLILKVLEDETLSTNALAKKLGYKGISKTLTGIVNELVQEGRIEYTNKNPRGSNQKLKKIH